MFTKIYQQKTEREFMGVSKYSTVLINLKNMIGLSLPNKIKFILNMFNHYKVPFSREKTKLLLQDKISDK